MKYKTRGGDHYRARAEECRTLADWLHHEELKLRMKQVAEDYETMAHVADHIFEQLEGEGEQW